MFVIPAAGLLVPDPAYQTMRAVRSLYFLPEGGREVQPSDFWQRRLASGEVTLGEAPAASVDNAQQQDGATT